MSASPPAFSVLAPLAGAFAESLPHHLFYGGSAGMPFGFTAARFHAVHGTTPQQVR